MIKIGSDLYIKKMDRGVQHKCGFEVSDEAIECGYFRDCYNTDGLFAVLSANLGKEYSWMDFSRRKDWFNKDDEMTVEGAKQFKSMMEEVRNNMKRLKELVVRTGDDRLAVRVMKPKEVREYMYWLDQLITFLSMAIVLDSEIIWSV